MRVKGQRARPPGEPRLRIPEPTATVRTGGTAVTNSKTEKTNRKTAAITIQRLFLKHTLKNLHLRELHPREVVTCPGIEVTLTVVSTPPTLTDPPGQATPLRAGGPGRQSGTRLVGGAIASDITFHSARFLQKGIFRLTHGQV